MTEEELYCTDCRHMFWVDSDTMEEMDCWNHAALPENGAPEIISSEPHNCPYWEPRGEVKISKRFLEIIKYEFIILNDLKMFRPFTDENGNELLEPFDNVDYSSYFIKELDKVLE